MVVILGLSLSSLEIRTAVSQSERQYPRANPAEEALKTSSCSFYPKIDTRVERLFTIYSSNLDPAWLGLLRFAPLTSYAKRKARSRALYWILA
jgi:hypothetical protein